MVPLHTKEVFEVAQISNSLAKNFFSLSMLENIVSFFLDLKSTVLGNSCLDQRCTVYLRKNSFLVGCLSPFLYKGCGLFNNVILSGFIYFSILTWYQNQLDLLFSNFPNSSLRLFFFFHEILTFEKKKKEI